MRNDEFRRLRMKVGTQARVAALMNVHVQSVTQWETGQRPITPARAEEIKRLAANPPAAMGAPITEVIFSVIDSSSNGVTIRRLDGTEQHVIAPAGSKVEVFADRCVVWDQRAGSAQ